MKRIAVGILPVAAAALVSSALAVTVKEHVDSMKSSGKPLVFEIDHGMYTCSSCEPEVKVKANGDSYKVSGHSDYDAVVVEVKSPTQVTVVEQHSGKNRAFYTYSVSPDGKTLTVRYSDYSGPKEKGGMYMARRVAAAPAGAHATSGSWQIEQVSEGAKGAGGSH